MLQSEIEFKDNGEFVEMWFEDDRPPFKDVLAGAFRKDEEGYFRFHPARKVVMTCKHLRIAAQKASELNT